ncbi:MAG TPA: TMEM43 family protein [Anaerolineae bacterium]|nr:TMEM43 family protein [Anaerolineae bacterium]
MGRLFMGGLLLIGMTALVWYNEGRVNWSEVTANSRPITITEPPPDDLGADNLVAITAPITTSAPLNDNLFLRPGPYALIERTVQIYTIDDNETDPREKWVNIDAMPETYQPPTWADNQLITNARFINDTPYLGPYQLNPTAIDWPDPQPLELSAATVIETPFLVIPQYIFSGTGHFNQPNIGDIRISYTTIPNGAQMTAFGTLTTDRLLPYQYRRDQTFYRLFYGERATALTTLDNEYRNLLWGFRLLGVVGIWIGLLLLASPVMGIVRWVPAVGKLTNYILTFVMLFVALLWTAIVALIAIIAHNIWLLLAVFLLIIGLSSWWLRTNSQPKE